MNTFNTTLLKTHHANRARVTRVTTPHGDFTTPTFMPVATRAYVNHMTPPQLKEAGSQIILGGNTYHMLCQPGMEVIQTLGGMHRFMNWHGPMLTDSGGFQIFSLSQNAKICTIDEEGARFKHPDTGAIIRMTPEVSIETQQIIGADIIMAFDQCTPEAGGREAALQALEKTHRWARQSKVFHDQHPYSKYGYQQALFGIIQGGSFRDLRENSAQFMVDLDFDGLAIGGEIIGFDMPKTVEILQWIMPILPQTKTRYAMGVGLDPQDLLDVVAEGIDIFDCVAPTRNARHGALYHGEFIDTGDWLKFQGLEADGNDRLLIKKSKYAKDERPIMAGCDCYTCQNFSRGFLHYLFKSKSVFYGNLATLHNVRVMQKTCELIYKKILKI